MDDWAAVSAVITLLQKLEMRYGESLEIFSANQDAHGEPFKRN